VTIHFSLLAHQGVMNLVSVL